MFDFFAILTRRFDQAGELKHIARQFGFSECPDSSDYKYGKNITTTRFRRHEDEHYPELELFVQYCPNGICYGTNSNPFDRRYHRHVSPPIKQSADEIREFLGKYLNEVNDLPVA